MSVILLEILTIFLLTLANGALAMSEIAIVSARKPRLQELAEDGDGRARTALELAREPTRFLSTVQIGITLVGILAGALGGATLAGELGALLGRVPPLAPYAEALSLGLVVLAIAYVSLVVGELAPKRLALANPEKIAAAVAGPMRALSRITAPIVRLLSVSTDALVRLLGAGRLAQPPVTEEEVKIMIETATDTGVFAQAEEDLVMQVFRLGDQRVSALMTHRTEITWLDLEDPPPVLAGAIASSGHSLFPVARGSLDNILGFVQARDLLGPCLSGQPLDLKGVLQPPLFLPENAPALEAIEALRQNRLPLALVIDEYGGLEGLLTVNDLLEAIVGELPSLEETLKPGAVQRADGSWLLDGMLPIEEFKALFEIEELPGEAKSHFETVSGFVMATLGRIPSTADHFEWGGYCFEVMDMDERRVDKVLVAPLQRGPCADGGEAPD